MEFGKKTGPNSVIRDSSKNYHIIDTRDLVNHWAGSIEKASIKNRRRGKKVEQSNPKSAGRTIELATLKTLLGSGIQSQRLGMSRRAHETIKQASNPDLHKHLDELIGAHII
jgi:hypothetical protein